MVNANAMIPIKQQGFITLSTLKQTSIEPAKKRATATQYHTKTVFNNCFNIYIQKVEDKAYYIIQKDISINSWRTSAHQTSLPSQIRNLGGFQL